LDSDFTPEYDSDDEPEEYFDEFDERYIYHPAQQHGIEIKSIDINTIPNPVRDPIPTTTPQDEHQPKRQKTQHDPKEKTSMPHTEAMIQIQDPSLTPTVSRLYRFGPPQKPHTGAKPGDKVEKKSQTNITDFLKKTDGGYCQTEHREE
jgi:hypothetical protein